MSRSRPTYLYVLPPVERHKEPLREISDPPKSHGVFSAMCIAGLIELVIICLAYWYWA